MFITSGSQPTDYLIEFVRKRQLVDLEFAHWHTSTLPAIAPGFADRGYLQVGMWAVPHKVGRVDYRRPETRPTTVIRPLVRLV